MGRLCWTRAPSAKVTACFERQPCSSPSSRETVGRPLRDQEALSRTTRQQVAAALRLRYSQHRRSTGGAPGRTRALKVEPTPRQLSQAAGDAEDAILLGATQSRRSISSIDPGSQALAEMAATLAR